MTTTNFRNERIEEATADLSMERMGAERMTTTNSSAWLSTSWRNERRNEGIGLRRSFLFLSCFEQLDHFVDAGAARLRPFGTLDPSDVGLAIEGRQRVKECFGL